MICVDRSEEKTILCGYFSEDSDVDKNFYLEVDTEESDPNFWQVYLCHKNLRRKIAMFGRPKTRYTPQDMLDLASEEEINASIKSFKRCFLGE